MDATAPWPARLGGWLAERFPPVVYTVLVALFHVSAIATARALGGGGSGEVPSAGWAVPAAVVVWLFFLHLRIFDEHKDHEADRIAYPKRLLSRGVVTLPLLVRVVAVAIAVEAAVAAALGPRAALAWLAAFGFSVAMRFEFGVGRWLREHIVLYAITHNPVVAGLAIFLWAASGAAWDPRFLWYVLAVSLGSLAFEIGRKTRLPEEEHPGVASYTTELGQGRARALLGAVHVGAGAALAALASSLGATPLYGLAVLPGLLTAIGRQPAKRVEAGASLALLGAMVAAAAAALGAS